MQQSLPAEQIESVFLYATNEMVERLNVRQAARKNHLLMNTFLIGWFIGFDEGKQPYVTGLVKKV